jgi:ribosomal protein S6--L-glutamate ligase
MKIAIISRGRLLFSTKRLAESARKRGHDVRILDPLQCVLTVDNNGPVLRHENLPVEAVDCIIPRVGGLGVEMTLPLLEHLRRQGAVCLNPPDAIRLARDKFDSLLTLSLHGLPVPRTALVRDPAQLDRALATIGPPPYVIKLREGTQGIGVIKADTLQAARSMTQALWSLNQPLLLQEFVANAHNADLRVFVIDGKAVAAMRRIAPVDDFRSNLHLGGSAERATLTPALRNLAVQAAQILGLRVAGVDILSADSDPVITEVNPSPGLEGIEGATGLDIARTIICAAERLTLGTSDN